MEPGPLSPATPIDSAPLGLDDEAHAWTRKEPPMNTRMLSSLALASLTALGACGDDPVKPGNVVVSWTHGPTATCGTRRADLSNPRGSRTRAN